MNKKVKKILIAVVCIIVGLILLHLTVNNLIPFIKDMHSGMY